jgi:hypothetical protein
VQRGVVNKYAYVIEAFTYLPNGLRTSDYFDQLVEQEIVREIVVQNGDDGLPISKYKPRFPAGTYLDYRSNADAVPEFYIAAQYFTPTSISAQDLLNQGLIYPLYINSVQYSTLILNLEEKIVKKPTRMFRFFKGDRTFFRQGSKILSYRATTNVHPLFEFYIYLQNGIFEPDAVYLPGQVESATYIPYFDPAYTLYSEDTIISEDGRNLYRVMKAFTPNATVVNWTNTTVVNTARIEEFEGNLLRYVNLYVCEEDILSQLGRDISAIKLGVAQITIIPKNIGRLSNSRQRVVYVWENTSTITETPQLSWYSGTTYNQDPPDYGEGTLRL